MKAARIHEYGGPEVLRVEQIDEPLYKPNEVLVRVRACSLNHLDLWVRKGRPKAPSLPWVLGSDVASGWSCRPG